jgi:hypothetical protein
VRRIVERYTVGLMLALHVGSLQVTALPVSCLAALMVGPAQAAEAGERRQLAEQKLKLLEAYMRAPSLAKVAESGNVEAENLLVQARQRLDVIRAALAADELANASRFLDEALRDVSTAAALVAKSSPPRSEHQQRERYGKLQAQIRSFLASVDEALQENRSSQAVAAAADRLNRLTARAERAAAAGRYGDANKLLAEAYQIAVTVVAELRHGETVVSALTFDTPADEFDYERNRNGSYEMLVDLMLAERESNRDLRGLAGRAVAESRRLRAEAAALAESGDYPVAIRTMEAATRHLVRVLQAGGLPVPE